MGQWAANAIHTIDYRFIIEFRSAWRQNSRFRGYRALMIRPPALSALQSLARLDLDRAFG